MSRPREKAGDYSSSHNNNNTSLPELRSTYHDSFGGSGGFMGPSYSPRKLAPVPPSPRGMDPTRIDHLENRITSQEKNAQSLLDKALKIKEDVIENLSLTQSTWQGEKKQRELLQEHIRSITELVKKMDRDIQYLEQQLRVKDGVIANTGSSLKAVELQQATSITDIRGRIARGDAAISKLSTDLIACQENVKQTNKEQLNNYQKLQDKIQSLEVKIAESAQKFERSTTETIIKSQASESDSSKQVALLETLLRSSIDEMKSSIATIKQQQQNERERDSTKFTMLTERQESSTRDKLDRMEQKLDDALRRMTADIHELKQSSAIKDIQRKQAALEKRLNDLTESTLRQQNEQIQRLKAECRSGFTTVHESITHSKQLLEGKLTLSEEQLRKEMAHIKKMVVLV